MSSVCIKPFLSSGEVFVHQDGTFEMAPMQLFVDKYGTAILRIGRNIYRFAPPADAAPAEGETPTLEYDGAEAKIVGLGNAVEHEIVEGYRKAIRNRGKRPADAYFGPGNRSHDLETAPWPPPEPAPVPAESPPSPPVPQSPTPTS